MDCRTQCDPTHVMSSSCLRVQANLCWILDCFDSMIDSMSGSMSDSMIDFLSEYPVRNPEGCHSRFPPSPSV